MIRSLRATPQYLRRLLKGHPQCGRGVPAFVTPILEFPSHTIDALDLLIFFKPSSYSGQ